MAAPSFDRPSSHPRPLLESDETVDSAPMRALSFRIGARIGKGDALDGSSRALKTRKSTPERKETTPGASATYVTSKSDDAISTAGPSSKSSDTVFTTIDSSSSSTKLSHSVSFSLKTFHKKPLVNSDKTGKELLNDDLDENRDQYCGETRAFIENDPFVDSSEISNKSSRLSKSTNPNRSSGLLEVASVDQNIGAASGSGGVVVARSPSVTVANFIHCKLCLCDYPPREMVQLSNCRCLFCADCVST